MSCSFEWKGSHRVPFTHDWWPGFENGVSTHFFQSPFVTLNVHCLFSWQCLYHLFPLSHFRLKLFFKGFVPWSSLCVGGENWLSNFSTGYLCVLLLPTQFNYLETVREITKVAVRLLFQRNCINNGLQSLQYNKVFYPNNVKPENRRSHLSGDLQTYIVFEMMHLKWMLVICKKLRIADYRSPFTYFPVSSAANSRHPNLAFSTWKKQMFP